MIHRRCLIFSILMTLFVPLMGHACTTFLLAHEDRRFFGKNYDWHLGHGMVIINQRGVVKTALKTRMKDPVPPPSWTSKYGSLTFNQYGRELPSGGMNEAGLAIEVMLLYEAEYPKPDTRRPVIDLQWIQYQLDNCSSVAEVIETNAAVRVQENQAPVHYLAADRSGNCVSVEYLDGKFVYHTQETMPVKALANSTYEDSLLYLNRHQGFGGTLPIGHGSNSLDRFVRTADMLKRFQSNPVEQMRDYAFDILESTSDATTKWRIVYDLKNLTVHFFIHPNPDGEIKFVDLKYFDLSCHGPVKVMNLDTGMSGNISDKFSDYSREKNQSIIRRALKNTSFTMDMPDEDIMKRVGYPDTTSCGE